MVAAIWYLYILRCVDESFYTGVTVDIPTRLKRHNAGKGAKYTRARRPCQLVYFEECEGETVARRREREIKGWNRAKKSALVDGFPSDRLADVLRIFGP